MKLYLASANPGKVREFQEAAAARGIAVEPVPGFENWPPCAEDGATFEENARKKALHYSAYVEGWVFADDSGICVDPLAGAPGVHSARFAGPEADDEANNRKLLAELLRAEMAERGTPSQRPATMHRSAHYVCVIALAQRGTVVTVVEGRADGVILDAPRGSGGFGYDPYFFYPPLAKTFAELTPEDKFAVSHRGEAFRKLLETLQGRLETTET
ncbi:MAG: RdgB/HAM1 family non-canonical purine NTP pyrophosphatase [Acidobacteria bacterium]|nr:RdgB/HAM1 family non-canonical purine NTP pyrophosphatase [Acidobacteriota bacterium]